MKTLIVGNWKMHGTRAWGGKPASFRTFFPIEEKQQESFEPQHNENPVYVLCPPFHLLAQMVDACAGLEVAVGAQNCHFKDQGAYTGEVSAPMLADLGVGYVILGHSERREMFGEKNKTVAKKGLAAQASGLTPIVCVGESADIRFAGQADEFVAKQLRKSLSKSADPKNLVIAYEPVWAIGSGVTPTIAEIAAMHDHIRGCLGGIYGERAAQYIPLLYGGSVKPTNAKDILALEDVNGALIGGASLDMESFAAIAKST